MKRTLLAIAGSMLLIISGYATSREKSEIIRSQVPTKPVLANQEVIGEINVNGQIFTVVTPPNSVSCSHTRANASTSVITEAPGTAGYYAKDVVGYGQGMPVQGYGVAATINWDGNDAYFFDIITAAPIGSYVKATKTSDTELTLPMGQTVIEFEDEEYDLNMGLLRPIFTMADGSIFVWFEYSDDYDSMSYTINKKGSLELTSPKAKYEVDGQPASYYGFPDYVIGYYYSDDYLWAGYCDVFQIYDRFDYEKVEMPEDLPTTTLTYINSDREGVIVTIAEDKANDALYVKGLSAYAPDAVFKADVIENGTKLSVAPNQYIGLEGGLYYIITTTVSNEEGKLVVAEDEPALFVVERDSNGKILSIKADPDSPFFLAFNDDPFFFYELDLFPNLTLTLQEEFYGIPATPYDAYYEDYSSLMGANFIFFRLSSFAYNGDIIDVNKLYYSIYVNGDPMEFEETDGVNLAGEDVVMYEGIKEPTYLIPYTFYNGVDLYEDMGGCFIVAIYAEGIETVGAQAVYQYKDTETRGGLLTIDTETGKQTITPGTDTKVESINIADVAAVEYYDLQGRKVGKPSAGLFVKKYKFNDGSVKSVKVLVK